MTDICDKCGLPRFKDMQQMQTEIERLRQTLHEVSLGWQATQRELANLEPGSKEYRKQVLLEAADRAVKYAWTGDYKYNCQTAEQLRKMAEDES